MLWVGCNGVCCYIVSSEVVGRECYGLVVMGYVVM